MPKEQLEHFQALAKKILDVFASGKKAELSPSLINEKAIEEARDFIKNELDSRARSAKNAGRKIETDDLKLSIKPKSVRQREWRRAKAAKTRDLESTET